MKIVASDCRFTITMLLSLKCFYQNNDSDGFEMEKKVRINTRGKIIDWDVDPRTVYSLSDIKVAFLV